MKVTAFGPSAPINLHNVPIRQGASVCSDNWKRPIPIRDGGLVEITTTSDVLGLDIDLYLAYDDGDGVFTCNDVPVASSLGVTADEFVSLKLPADGLYFAVVFGYAVPGGAADFDITIRAIQGQGLTIDGAPTGALAANTPLPFRIAATVPYEPDAALEGLLFVGPRESPTALSIPVTITVPALDAGGLNAQLTAGPEGVTTGETTMVRLWAWNTSADAEFVDVAIAVPPGLTANPGSVHASQGHAFFNVADRKVYWSGMLAGSSGLTITFEATAATHSGMVTVAAQIDGLLRGNSLRLTAPVWVNVDAPPRLIHMPLVAGE